MNKKGKFGINVINTAILAIIVLVILFQAFATIMPTAQTTGNAMNATNQCEAAGCFYNTTNTVAVCTGNSNASQGICTALGTGTVGTPLAGLFAGTGVIFVIIMAALLIIVVKGFMSKK